MIRHLKHDPENRLPVFGSCSDNVEREDVSKTRHLALGAAILALSLCALFSTASGKGTETPVFAAVSEDASMPIGWAQFCETYEGICDTSPSTPRDMLLDGKA